MGEVLGRDARWTWAEFKPRINAKGEITETGDDRIIGQGADEGRIPGALWGDRPDEAWYVLEALARYRQGDPTAPYMPFAVPQRAPKPPRPPGPAHGAGHEICPSRWSGSRTSWSRGGSRLAGGPRGPAGGGGAEGEALAFRAFVRLGQAKLNEEAFRWLVAHARTGACRVPWI